MLRHCFVFIVNLVFCARFEGFVCDGSIISTAFYIYIYIYIYIYNKWFEYVKQK